MNIDYIHTLRIFETTVDEYGQQVVTAYHDVSAVFEQNINFAHGNNRNSLDADAVALVDPADPFALDEAYRLEELVVLANPFSGAEEEQWFKITSVTLGQYHQTSGEVNTVNLSLKKTRALDYVS